MQETERERNRKEAYSREAQEIREEQVGKRIEVFRKRCKIERKRRGMRGERERWGGI